MPNKRVRHTRHLRQQKGGKARTRAAKRAQARAQQRNQVSNNVGSNNHANNPVNPNNSLNITNTRRNNSSNIANNSSSNVIPEPNAVHNVVNVANASLPEGWKKEQMANHPAVVWYEKNNGTEQWFPPGAEEDDPTMFTNNVNLPTGWRKAYHRNNNVDPKLYWYVSPNNQTSWTRPNVSNNVSANTPLAPAAINALNQRETNLSPNIQGKINSIKRKITNINHTLRSFQPTQTGGRRYGCGTRKA